MSDPSTHRVPVTCPVLTKDMGQLLFFPSNHHVHKADVDGGKSNRHGRTENQRGSEKDKYIAAEVERIS